MRALASHWIHDWIGKGRSTGPGILILAVIAGLVGWYVWAHAFTPAPTVSKPAIQPLWMLPMSAYAGPHANAHPGEFKMGVREAALLWAKAGKEVEIRQHALDKARADYLRIRRELAKAGLSDDYIQLARQRVEEAAEALQEAKSNLAELRWLAYRTSQEAQEEESALKSAAR